MNVYPSDFESDEFNEKTDPDGLREFFYARLKEVAGHILFEKDISENSNKKSAKLKIKARFQDVGGSLTEQIRLQLADREVIKLISMAEKYMDEIKRESGVSNKFEIDSKKLMNDPVSYRVFLTSNMSAGILKKIFNETLNIEEDEKL